MIPVSKPGLILLNHVHSNDNPRKSLIIQAFLPLYKSERCRKLYRVINSALFLPSFFNFYPTFFLSRLDGKLIFVDFLCSSYWYP